METAELLSEIPVAKFVPLCVSEFVRVWVHACARKPRVTAKWISSLSLSLYLFLSLSQYDNICGTYGETHCQSHSISKCEDFHKIEAGLLHRMWEKL